MLFVPHPVYSVIPICQLYTSNVSKRILKNYYGANLFPNCLLASGHVNKILFPCGKRQETMKQLLYTYTHTLENYYETGVLALLSIDKSLKC